MSSDVGQSLHALLLAGKRVLIVEDEYYLADDIRRTLTAAGASISGSFSTVGEAQTAIEHGDFDCAVLDINLHGKSAAPLATQLRAKGKPFVLATGYGRSAVPGELDEMPRIEKPFDPAALVKMLAQLGCSLADQSRERREARGSGSGSANRQVRYTWHSSCFRLLFKRWGRCCRSIDYGAVTLGCGIILPAWKAPDLLDFPALTRK